MRRWLLLAVLGACEPSSAHAPPAPAIDAGCVPMPIDCPPTLDCAVDPQTRTCTGASCCLAFCVENGCSTCCAAR